jgi:methyltransferase (TIGR00027 family)
MLTKPVPSGVGRTAIMVSWIRSAEGRRPDGLFVDPFADQVLAELADLPETADLTAALRDGTTPLAEQLSSPDFSFILVRMRYFDDQLIVAMRSGIHQVVSLAAGLDGRSVRLDCPPATDWYEVDLPAMEAFKGELLSRSTRPATCRRHGVAADLAGEWAPQLRRAGFDPKAPTAWLVGGLLMYRSEEDGDQLVATVTELSAPGSMLLVEHLSTNSLRNTDTPFRAAVESRGARWVSARDDLVPWIAGHGWQALAFSNNDAISHERAVRGPGSRWSVALGGSRDPSRRIAHPRGRPARGRTRRDAASRG